MADRAACRFIANQSPGRLHHRQPFAFEINLYLQVRDGSTPVINAISLLLIVGTSSLALANLYFSRKKD